ncbi:MAG TPA: CHAT domain-containing protein, partial [Candidatus Eisenbacteria bacterium]|nr:CHAT domain-containing protein [Candidatus Eisenbacteria bacterium]
GIGGLAPAAARAVPEELAAPGENPLLFSGLALAGANLRARAAPGAGDGILTAQEIATLDLDGVDWAVLSACRTGVGEVVAGEGVLGLRRAFLLAGARSVVTSLWSVGDQGARAWMAALYRHRLLHKATTCAAVRAATLESLRARRARGQSTHPFHWAAFVALGDWR